MRISGTMKAFARAPASLMVLICLAGPPSLGHADEIYKSVDAQGHVVYSDHADPNAPKNAVQVNARGAMQAAKAAKLQAAQIAAGQQRKRQQALEAAKMAQRDRDAKVECDEAQKNFYAMKALGATDAVAAMKREEARRSMVLACTD